MCSNDFPLVFLSIRVESVYNTGYYSYTFFPVLFRGHRRPNNRDVVYIYSLHPWNVVYECSYFEILAFRFSSSKCINNMPSATGRFAFSLCNPNSLTLSKNNSFLRQSSAIAVRHLLRHVFYMHCYHGTRLHRT